MPFIIAIVGRPNTGKSTLFNRLTRTRKAIVDSTAGVTRDRNYCHVSWEGKEFLLVDTGGLEPGDAGGMITKMQEQTALAMQEADAVVFLMDGREGLTPDDAETVDRLRRMDKPVFYVVNKIDGLEREDLVAEFYRLGVDPIYSISAEHGYGVNDFMDVLTSHVPSEEQPQAEEGIIRIAVLGRPNVGKSSLVNKLLGEERMLVTEVAGTTRDAVDVLLEKSGKTYRLIDTAGIRRKGRVTERLETYSVIKALRGLHECDVALVLIDAGEGITDQDVRIVGYAAEHFKGCILVANKWDLVKDDARLKKKIKEDIAKATPFIPYAPLLTVSALNGLNMGQVLRSVNQVYEQYATRVSTGKLNQELKKIVSRHEPPLHQGRRVKFYYATQVRTKPPSFVVFTNYPSAVRTPYHRYLTNQLREHFVFDKSPIKIVFRERERKERS